MLTKSRFKFCQLYFPGLISLVLLPLICVIYLWNEGRFQKIGVMDIVTYDTEALNRLHKYTSFPLNFATYRHYQQIQFTGNVYNDDVKQIEFSHLIKQLSVKNDLSNGIHISFGKHAKYKDFIAILDIGNHYEDMNISMLPYNGEIYIWAHKPYVTFKDYIPMHPLLYNDILYVKLKPSFYDKFIENLKQLIPYWPSGIILLLMIGLLVTKKRYFFINRSTSIHN